MRFLSPIIFCCLVFLFACNSNPAESKTTTAQKGKPTQNVSAGDPTVPTKFVDLNVEEFKSKMTDENVVVLDVRTPKEVAAGKIENAEVLDFYSKDFLDKLQTFDKDKTYLVYCKSGGRSATACGMMKAAGFKEVYNLDGGYTAFNK